MPDSPVRGLVVAGAKRAPGAREDDDAYGAVRIGLVQAAVQLGFELVRERVHALRPVERNGRDGLIDLIQQLLAHPCSLSLLSRYPGAKRASPAMTV